MRKKIHRRRKLFKRIEIALHRSPFLPFGGISRVGRRLVGRFLVNRLTADFPDLPEPWDGLTITHLTDTHFGLTFTAEYHLPPVLRTCEELDSDLVCITGDWIDTENRFLSPALELFRRMKAPRLGFACVLGNHDAFDNRREVIRLLRGWLGSRLLINDVLVLERQHQPLAVLGIDYPISNRHLHRCLARIQAKRPFGPVFTLGLSHDPHVFDQWKEKSVALTLAGHTHGGQFSFTKAPLRVIGPTMFRFKYYRGFYESDGAKLYVNCGIGQGVPLRINSPAEITQITFRRRSPPCAAGN
jgi:predicted MPP superfamily phosphohydrolase